MASEYLFELYTHESMEGLDLKCVLLNLLIQMVSSYENDHYATTHINQYLSLQELDKFSNHQHEKLGFQKIPKHK